jgi:hypothetical protein
MPRPLVALAILAATLGISSAVSQSAEPPRPPQQSATGPGGTEYRFGSVEAVRIGEPPTGTWVFLPRNPEPGVGVSPVPFVVFLHGFTALDPNLYRSWIDHLVKRGAVVAYPDYQTTGPFGTAAIEMLPNAADGILSAIAVAERDAVAIDTDRMAVVGHSLGGVLAAGVGAAAASHGLPKPVALMPINPGGCRSCGGPLLAGGVPLPDLAAVPADVLVAVVVSEDDELVGDSAARAIWSGLGHLPPIHRDFVIVRTDRHGSPDLVADHNAPQTGAIWFGEREDALDWNGYWKQFDLLIACAFARSRCSDALGNAPLQRSMGSWSDGTPVRELLVTDRPPSLDDAS